MGMMLRRHYKEVEKPLEEPKVDLSKLTNVELRNMLDEKGIEYDSKMVKDELIRLLEGK